MLDKNSEKLLQFICEYCNGAYKIVTLNQLIEALSCGKEDLTEEIKRCVKKLATENYILNKYFDGEQYCLYALPKGREYLQGKQEEKKQELLYKLDLKKTVFWASFFSSLAVATLNIIASIIIKLC